MSDCVFYDKLQYPTRQQMRDHIDHLHQLLEQRATEIGQMRREIDAILENCPDTIHVREGGGPENLVASLAVTVAKISKELKEYKEKSGYWDGSKPEKVLVHCPKCTRLSGSQITGVKHAPPICE